MFIRLAFLLEIPWGCGALYSFARLSGKRALAGFSGEC